MCCLLVVASALPAADPRLESPGSVDGGTSAGDWESVAPSPNPTDDPTDTDADRDDDGGTDDDTHDIEIEGDIEPGNEVRVSLDGTSHFDKKAVEVNGESVGETEFGSVSVVVPYAAEMNVTVPDTDQSRTVDVETAATIEPDDGAAPARDLEVAVAVGSTPVSDATVFLDGDSVATTDEDGTATVPLPDTARPVDLRVERGPVEGERTVDVAEPEIGFTSPVLFPGSPAPVQVSADGAAVPNATVSLEGGGSTTTDGSGQTRVWLPIDDAATVSVEVGEETATTSVENLYLRLTVLVVFGPGILIGGAVTYLRFAATHEPRRNRISTGIFVGLADLLAALSDALRRRANSFSRFRLPSLTSIPMPSVSIPRPDIGGGLRSFGTALSSLGTAFGTLPSFGSLLRGPNRSENSIGSLFRDRFGFDDEREDAGESADDRLRPQLADEPLAPRGPRAEVRTAWHAFLDRLGVEERETRTPGQVARDALAAGFPAASVYRLVSIFRDVEYGDREPSPDRVEAARAAADDLIDHEVGSDENEEGSE
ncbi:protein of unknown function [Natronorubrum texcoconense]|uniref:Protein-glutamine gamma-glutamyltransferase-like C-terminal domain-containing protein n=2 Tax=Natronorubrum texcoconense TaxID=1095776 RepID=A0A1G8YU10_9EURY|nr:protein of unknown function [Natronorubrum texcoconense]